MSAWGKAFAKAWGAAWGVVESVVVSTVDGAKKRRRKRIVERPAKPLDTYRTPEDIRREQLEDERYLAELENRKTTTAKPEGYGPKAEPVVQPVLADVAARAASAAQAKIREAAEAAATSRLAQDKRRRTLALLLALD